LGSFTGEEFTPSSYIPIHAYDQIHSVVVNRSILMLTSSFSHPSFHTSRRRSNCKHPTPPHISHDDSSRRINPCRPSFLPSRPFPCPPRIPRVGGYQWRTNDSCSGIMRGSRRRCRRCSVLLPVLPVLFYHQIQLGTYLRQQQQWRSILWSFWKDKSRFRTNSNGGLPR
jgi:hypothetical protein